MKTTARAVFAIWFIMPFKLDLTYPVCNELSVTEIR